VIWRVHYGSASFRVSATPIGRHLWHASIVAGLPVVTTIGKVVVGFRVKQAVVRAFGSLVAVD